MKSRIAACALAALLTACAGMPASQVRDEPTKALPYSPSLDLTSMDKSVDPCADFYTYSCGNWIKKNPIPPDQSSWSVYGKLYVDNQRYLWGILQDLSVKTGGRNAAQQKIGDYFAACMDESAIEARGAQPLQPQLDAIAALKSKKDLAPLLARLHLDHSSNRLLFGFGSNQDFEDAESVIAFATAGGLGLPDRDYYFMTDEKTATIRDKYVAHVQRMFELLGADRAVAKSQAASILKFETALAKASLTRVEKRDPHKLLHKYKRSSLSGKLTPSFDWEAYLKAVGLPSLQRFNVTEPAFFKALESELKRASLDDLKTYLRWHVVLENAAVLSSAFVNENFDFYGRTLYGRQELRPRWKRCVTYVDNQLGEALGQEFVARTFPPELKAKTVEMTKYIEEAMAKDIEQLDWMGPETKKQALTKLHTIVNKVGYPDKWRDYSAVEVRRDDFTGNTWRANAFESRRQLAKIGKPLDRTEWQMTPPTVNAYYDPQMNDVNFPAGVLQPPLYDAKMDDAPNYGNTGATIGHELTHGFDDEGRQFDARGNLKDWWTKKDAKAFDERAACVVDQYAKYTVIDDIKINSKLTLGEDIADLGGTILAYVAWKAATKDEQLKDIDGLTPDQRFFIGYAQWDCNDERPESKRANAITNPHSPGQYRINGVVVNMPEFAQAFSCKKGAPMVSEKPCRVW
jgi:putative endopeptidase